MRKYVLCPLAALALGCGGAALRMRQPGELSPMLIALCVLSAALFALAAFRFKGCRSGAFFTRSPFFSPLLLLVGAVALGVAAMLRLAHAATLAGIGPESEISPLRIFTLSPLEVILALLSIPSVISFAFLAKDARSGDGKAMKSAAVVFPALFCWVWLIDVYRSNTSNPVISDYIFLLVAVIALLLTALGRAGFSFGDGKPALTLFFGLCALFLFPMALTHSLSPAAMLTAAATALFALDTLTGLLRDLPMPERVCETENETETEEPSDE